MKQLLRILVKALENFTDIALLEGLVMCLTRLQPLLRPVIILFVIFCLYVLYVYFIFEINF